MSEFDYWPAGSLQHLASSLEYFDEPPSTDDKNFWECLAGQCQAADLTGELAVDAAELAQDVANEFESARSMRPSNVPGIAVGDLSCSESRLVSATRKIQGVLFMSSHAMEHLWAEDGIKYHTLIVSPVVEASKTLSSQCSAAIAFLRANKPAIISSSCRALPAVLLAAYTFHEANGTLSIHTALAAAENALGLSAGDVGAAEVVELERFVALRMPPIKAPPPQPTTAPALDDTDDEIVDDEAAKSGSDAGSVDDEAAALSTPRCRPRVASIPPVELLRVQRSNDSTSTQINAALVASETPRKRRASDDEMQGEGAITLGGRWKRRHSAESSLVSIGAIAKDGDSVSSTVKATSVISSPTDVAGISRGSCSTCLQVCDQ